MKKTTLLSVVLAAACSAAPALANDWYQWRGPEQTGVSRETNLPEKWTPEGENLAWSAPVGGMSCPIVMNGYLYSFTRVGEVPAGAGAVATGLCRPSLQILEIWKPMPTVLQQQRSIRPLKHQTVPIRFSIGWFIPLAARRRR